MGEVGKLKSALILAMIGRCEGLFLYDGRTERLPDTQSNPI